MQQSTKDERENGKIPNKTRQISKLHKSGQIRITFNSCRVIFIFSKTFGGIVPLTCKELRQPKRHISEF